jgi:uncharacterized protein (DUF4415 family)
MREKKERIVRVRIDPANRVPLTPRQKRERAALAKMSDADIDYSDIPPLSAATLRTAVRTGLYRPVKRQMTVRLDADVLAWLKSQGKGYHGRLNWILRTAMLNDLHKGA